MKIAIISDTHFGDSACQLFNASGKGAKYQLFYDAIRDYAPLDYLVLAGDIFDFAISSYHEAFQISQEFFMQIKRDNVAKEMIYLAGNHDFDIWHVVEYEVNVVHRMKEKCKLPRLFKMSLPGILDDRPQEENSVFLPGVTRNEGKLPYAGLFLDNITRKIGEPDSEKTSFNFVYPNLYLITNEGETILITHGQYMDPKLSWLGEFAGLLEKDRLKIANLQNMTSINFPFSQLASSGVGQAGKLTEVASEIEHQVKAGNLEQVKRYLNTLQDTLSDYVKNRLLLGLARIAFWFLKRIFVRNLDTAIDSRYSEDFMHKDKVRKSFIKFFDATCNEIDSVNEANHVVKEIALKDISYPRRVIFGHTHQPIPWGSDAAPQIEMGRLGGDMLKLYNAGGWLQRGDHFVGAEVFIYETGKELRSVTIA